MGTNDDNKDTDKNNKLSESKENNKDNIEKFTSNFKESMNYLSNLVEKDKKSKRKRKQKTLKSKTPNEIDPNDIEVSLKLPDDFSEKINFSSEDHNRFNYYDKGT